MKWLSLITTLPLIRITFSGIDMNRKEVIKEVIDTSLVAKMTVREVERIDYVVRKAGGSSNAGVDQKVGIAAMYVWNNIKKYRFTEQGTQLTVERLLDIVQDTRIRFIQQHIINYAAYDIVIDFYDWLCEKKYMNKASEGYWRKIERCFSDYQREQKQFMEKSTWVMFKDHMRLSTDSIRPQLEALEKAIRDYLIQHRKDIVEAKQKDDIALLQKASMCFVLLTAMQHSYKDFFGDIIKVHGVDFSCDFRYAEISKMIRNTVWMCEKIGIKFRIDSDRDLELVGVNINDSVRVKSAWNAIVEALCDSELMNETAMRAICLNPEEKEKFYDEYAKELAIINDREQKDLEVGLEQLKDKYNVRK